MAIKEVVKNPTKVLSQKTKEVEVIDESTIQLLDDLYDTMVENDGVGIAAPQINVGLRVAIVELGEDILEMINPVVLETRGEEGRWKLSARRWRHSRNTSQFPSIPLR